MSDSSIKQQTKISWQCNFAANVLNDFCIQRGGAAIVAENTSEKLLIGYNNAVGPKCCVAYIGEEPYGDESTQELTGRVIRHFDVLVSRGKIFADPRNSSLTTPTGASEAFYDQLEQIRDVVRTLIWSTPVVYNPTLYKGIRAVDNGADKIDSFIISFALIVQIGRIQVDAPEVAPNPPQWVQINDNENIVNNKSLD